MFPMSYMGPFEWNFAKEAPIFLRLKNFPSLEAIAMLVSFLTNVRKLGSGKVNPRYGRFREKGSKTSKISKLTR